MYLLFAISLFFQNAHATEIYLSPGAQKTLPVPRHTTVKIKGRNIVSAQLTNGALKIFALSAGQATVTTNHEIFSIYVIPNNKSQFFHQLKTLMLSFMGLKLSLSGGEIVITGRLHRLSDWQEISDLAAEYRADYRMEARLDPDVVEPAQVWLREEVRFAKGFIPQLQWQPYATVYLPERFQKSPPPWLPKLSWLGLTIKYEKDALKTEPLVRVRIVVAEVNKKVQTQLGLQWPEALSAQVLPKWGGVQAFEVFLKALEEKGMGQILASPTLLARSGSEAEFLAGGEFGIKILRAKIRDVIWKKHGILLKIKPKADLAGRLSIELTTEVSLIDSAQTVDGIPALKTNRMSTHFDLNQARTIALSGLIRNDWGKDQSGIWGLGNLPILGALFRSESFYHNKTELVIFVSPEIVNEEEPSTDQTMPKDWIDHVRAE